jgi:hypothetical protein
MKTILYESSLEINVDKLREVTEGKMFLFSSISEILLYNILVGHCHHLLYV